MVARRPGTEACWNSGAAALPPYGDPQAKGRQKEPEGGLSTCLCLRWPSGNSGATLACPSRRHAIRRILRSVFTITATAGSVSTCASVAGLRNSTLGRVVISVVSVLTIRHVISGASSSAYRSLCPLTKVLGSQPRLVGCFALV